jgi:hypothetical protein
MHPYRLLLLAWGLLALLRRLLIAHLQVVNEGSPSPDEPFAIEDVTLSQAFYARLAAGGSDYYRFTLEAPTQVRLSMLVPERAYAVGFRPHLALRGGALPAEGLALPAGDEGMRQGTTLYRRTQRTEPLLEPGSYTVAVASDTPGTYCFCVGTREPDEYANDATRARVQELLAE